MSYIKEKINQENKKKIKLVLRLFFFFLRLGGRAGDEKQRLQEFFS